MSLLEGHLLLDGLLAVTLLGLGWAAVATRDPRRGIPLFIAFGLLMALVWLRLDAPDVALAEAAIGAGVAGVLLLAALGDQGGSDDAAAQPAAARPLAHGILDLLTLALAALVGSAYVHAITAGDVTGLAPLVAANLPASGVDNPVTAVLLNFRSYDTLLELAVLLTAVLGIIALGPARAPHRPAEPVLAGLVSWLVPLLMLMGGYLLWVGAHAPGGAFQAGALLAGAGVVLRMAGHPSGGLPAGGILRGTVIGGVALFTLVGLALMSGGRPFLAYPAGWAGPLILLIETAATLAIAAALVLTLVGGRPLGWHGDESPGARS